MKHIYICGKCKTEHGSDYPVECKKCGHTGFLLKKVEK